VKRTAEASKIVSWEIKEAHKLRKSFYREAEACSPPQVRNNYLPYKTYLKKAVYVAMVFGCPMGTQTHPATLIGISISSGKKIHLLCYVKCRMKVENLQFDL